MLSGQAVKKVKLSFNGAAANASPGGKLSSVSETEEECGQKSNDFASLPGFFRTSDFAVPLPTRLAAGHLPPGGRYIERSRATATIVR